MLYSVCAANVKRVGKSVPSRWPGVPGRTSSVLYSRLPGQYCLSLEHCCNAHIYRGVRCEWLLWYMAYMTGYVLPVVQWMNDFVLHDRDSKAPVLASDWLGTTTHRRMPVREAQAPTPRNKRAGERTSPSLSYSSPLLFTFSSTF